MVEVEGHAVACGYANGVCLVSVVGCSVGGMDFGRTELLVLTFFIHVLFLFSFLVCCSCLSDIQMYNREGEGDGGWGC